MNTYTQNLKLAKPAVSDRNWNVPLSANSDLLDATVLGDLAVTPTEVPSASANVRVASGQYQAQDGSVGTFAGSAAYTVASGTWSLYLDGTAAYALAAAGAYPATPHVRLGTVTVTGGVVAAITDDRVMCAVSGSIAEGVSITVGTVTGLKIGTAPAQKIGFFGATPVGQQSLGAATATTSWTSTEQGMLQRVYNAMRTLGLGS
jgi:hypothetical protein